MIILLCPSKLFPFFYLPTRTHIQTFPIEKSQTILFTYKRNNETLYVTGHSYLISSHRFILLTQSHIKSAEQRKTHDK